LKRFTDTEKWSDPWYRELQPKMKSLWGYMWDRCNSAGVWIPDFKLASFCVGETILEDEAWAVLCGRVTKVTAGWFINEFIEFQYGNLDPKCRPHASVLALLEKLRIGYPKGIHTLKDKEKDQEKDKVRTGGIAKGGFAKPTMAEMELHAAKIGFPPTELNKFFNYYEANGWRVGRNPMKSWQAAMVNWRENTQRYGTKTNGSANAKSTEPDYSKGF